MTTVSTGLWYIFGIALPPYTKTPGSIITLLFLCLLAEPERQPQQFAGNQEPNEALSLVYHKKAQLLSLNWDSLGERKEALTCVVHLVPLELVSQPCLTIKTTKPFPRKWKDTSIF